MTKRPNLPAEVRDAGLLERRRFLKNCGFGLGALFMGGAMSPLARAVSPALGGLPGSLRRAPGFGKAKKVLYLEPNEVRALIQRVGKSVIKRDIQRALYRIHRRPSNEQKLF